MRKYDEVECKMEVRSPDDTKQGCDHHDVGNKIENGLKTRRHGILASRFIVECTIEGAFVCDVDETMVTDLTVYAASNITELFIHILFVLQRYHLMNLVLRHSCTTH